MENSQKDKIAQLKKDTQCSLSDISTALKENDWDIEGALKTLRILNKTKADKLSSEEALEGKIGSYVHAGSKLAVFVEVNCQTDFAANSPEFLTFCNDLAMHIAAMNPKYISDSYISEQDASEMVEIFLNQIKNISSFRTLSEKETDKIIDGKMKKWRDEVCLLNQKSIRDGSKSIEELRQSLAAQIKENVKIKRFTRWSVA